MNTKNDINLIESILRLGNRCISEKEKKEVLHDLSPREAEIITSINPGEILGSTDLAHRNNLSPSRMTRIIDKLCNKGYCKRHHSRKDRRSVEVSLSEKGSTRRTILMDHSLSCEENLRSRLNDDELQKVEEALAILAQKLREDRND